MTRETKIGLLVGLAFIIVIGVLLSDHFTTSVQPNRADISKTHDQVLESVPTPGVRRSRPEQRPNDRVEDPEITRPLITDEPQPRSRGSIDIYPRPRVGNSVDVGPMNDGDNLLNRNPREVANNDQEGNADHQADPDSRTTLEVKEYVAERGDTLWSITRKAYGKADKASVDRIKDANPSLKANPNKISPGTTYNIPTEVALAPAGVSIIAPPPTNNVATIETRLDHNPERPAPIEPVKASNRPIPTVDYTTKPGDSLWKIAMYQCNGGGQAAVKQIMELNGMKDDKIKPNMQLKLPAKQK